MRVYIVTRRHLNYAIQRYPDAANEIKARGGDSRRDPMAQLLRSSQHVHGCRLCQWLRGFQLPKESVSAHHRRPLREDDR